MTTLQTLAPSYRQGPPATIQEERPAAEEAATAYLIKCDCGHVSRGETEDELVQATNRHIDEVHPDMAGKVSRDDLLAMAEET